MLISSERVRDACRKTHPWHREPSHEIGGRVVDRGRRKGRQCATVIDHPVAEREGWGIRVGLVD